MTSRIPDVLERDELEREASQTVARVLSTAELAECTCPEFCERDHDTD